MDGYEATCVIRKKELADKSDRARHIPIVALTANVMDGDRERCLEVGMDDFISKPIRSAELTQALKKWIGGTPSPSPSERANAD